MKWNRVKAPAAGCISRGVIKERWYGSVTMVREAVERKF